MLLNCDELIDISTAETWKFEKQTRIKLFYKRKKTTQHTQKEVRARGIMSRKLIESDSRQKQNLAYASEAEESENNSDLEAFQFIPEQISRYQV